MSRYRVSLSDLIDLLHRSGAVDELLELVSVDQVVGHDEGEERRRLPGP